MAEIEEVKTIVRNAIAKSLEIETDEFQDDSAFADIGLDSISATEVVKLIKIELGEEVDMSGSDVFDHPSVNDLAEYVCTLIS